MNCQISSHSIHNHKRHIKLRHNNQPHETMPDIYKLCVQHRLSLHPDI